MTRVAVAVSLAKGTPRFVDIDVNTASTAH